MFSFSYCSTYFSLKGCQRPSWLRLLFVLLIAGSSRVVLVVYHGRALCTAVSLSQQTRGAPAAPGHWSPVGYRPLPEHAASHSDSSSPVAVPDRAVV